MTRLFRIVARDPSGSGIAYAEKIRDYELLEDGEALVTDLDGFQWYADARDIVMTPVVCKMVTGGRLFKILLKGGERYASDL